MAPKLSESCPKVIGTFLIISEVFRRLPKISEEKSENVRLYIKDKQFIHHFNKAKKLKSMLYLLQCKNVIFLSEKKPL